MLSSMKVDRPVNLPSLTFSGYQCGFFIFQSSFERSVSLSSVTVADFCLCLLSWPFYAKYSVNFSLRTNWYMSLAKFSLLKFFWAGQKERPSSKTDISSSLSFRLDKL